MAIGRFPILFITASRVGDAVLTSGLLHRLSEEIPHARFTVVASPLTAPLFRDIPNLDRLIPLEKEKASLHWFKLWRMVRGRRWGVIVDMRGSALSRFLNARRRAVKKPLSPGLEPVHKVIEAARVLRIEDDPPAPYLFTSAETEAAAEALLAGGEGPILAMAPAANWVGKTWPAERFAVVAAEMLGPGGPMANGRLLLLGGPSDRFAAEAVRRVIPRARLIDTVGKLDLLTAYAVLKRVRLFIGNDSGLMHLAAAAGAPTLGLFGPSDDRLYAPWGPKARTLRGPREFEVFKKIDPDLNQVVCHMFDLPTPWVTAAARKLFAETAEPVEIEAIDVEATEVALLEGPAAHASEPAQVDPEAPQSELTRDKLSAAEPPEAELPEPELDVVEGPSPTSASA